MMQSLVTEPYEVSVLEVEREAVTSFVRAMVCDSHLRARFASEPEAALAESGVLLSAQTQAALVEHAPGLLRATEGIDNPQAAFFVVIIITKPS